MQPITLGFYKAFLPELRERLDVHAAALRWRDYQSFEVRDLRIRPSTDPIGEWVAVVTVDIVGKRVAYDEELAEIEDISVSFGLHCMRAIRPLVSRQVGFHFQWNWQQPIVAWMEDLLPALKRRVATLSDQWKEEIVAKIWSPERLAARLDQGGWELVEAL